MITYGGNMHSIAKVQQPTAKACPFCKTVVDVSKLQRVRWERRSVWCCPSCATKKRNRSGIERDLLGRVGDWKHTQINREHSEKTCKQCGETKPLSDFAKCGTVDGVQKYRATCKACRNEQLIEYRAKKKAEQANRHDIIVNLLNQSGDSYEEQANAIGITAGDLFDLIRGGTNPVSVRKFASYFNIDAKLLEKKGAKK